MDASIETMRILIECEIHVTVEEKLLVFMHVLVGKLG